ncbi:hypothetical protein A9Q81_23655 [Gammaproteobacteria bacterium 42_54_T18]|nr:hypothetical protein A9Q81_23655 [Gammaproteobacteria bacterium 42_54_T18]
MGLNIHLFRFFLLGLIGLAVTGCGGSYTISEPAEDSVHTNAPSIFVVGYKSQPAELPVMILNGLSVESHFTAGASEATAAGSDLVDFFIEGKNTFQVQPPLGPSVRFVYDTEGPRVILLGAEEDGLMKINGLAFDETGIETLSVNGTDISLAEDGSFAVEVMPADLYTYQGEDSIGHTSTVKYASLGLEYDPSLTVKITQEGLNLALNQVVNVLNGLDINSLVAGTMLYDKTSKGLFGETYGIDGYIREMPALSIENFNLDLENGNKAIINTHITTANVKLALRMHNGFLPATVIKIGANIGPIDIDGDLYFDVADQVPEFTIDNTSIHIGKVDFDGVGSIFEPILSEVSSGIINLLEGPISGAIEKALEKNLPEALAGIIKQSYMISFDDGISSRDLAVSLNLEKISTSNNSLTAQMSGGVIPVTPDLDIPQPLAGTLFTDEVLPAADADQDQFAVSINTNVISQTLASAHSVGLTHLNVVGEKIQFGLPRTDDFGDTSVNSRILVDNIAPLTLEVEEVGGVPRVVISIFGMEVHAQLKEGDSFNDNISVRFNVSAPVSIDITDDNTLEIGVPSNPEIDLIAFRIGTGSWVAGSVSSIADEAVDSAIGQILTELTKPIASIALPTFGCMAFDSASISAVGGNNSHLNVSGALIKVSDECDVDVLPPPQVAYGRGVGTPLTCASDEDYDAGLCYVPCRDTYNGVGPVCWKKNASYGRGVGTIPTQCGSGKENDAGLCYPDCRSGYHGIGPVCWSNDKLSYGRGVGTIPSNIWTGRCPSGKENDAGLCYKHCRSGYNGVGPVCWLIDASYGRGVGTIPKACGGGDENDAGLCYPVCRSDYHGVGPVCWTNDSLSYGRGVGKPIHACNDGDDKDGLLCYEPCREGYNGIGPVCWPKDG